MKRVRTSSRHYKDLTKLETQREAKIEELANYYASTAAATDQRLALLEKLTTTSFQTIQERFDFTDPTLKSIVRRPVFAAQFANHPSLQEQTQSPTLPQPRASPKPE